MKTNRWLGLAMFAASAVVISACGNNGVIDGLTGASNSKGMNAEQQASVDNLAGHWCETCEIPADGAEHMEVGILPADYTGGALSLVVSYVDPAGVKDASGAWRIGRTLTINGDDLLASVPDAAWKISNDGKRARITFNSDAGLAPGTYVVAASISDEGVSADNSRTYTVGDHTEPTPVESPTETHHEPTPTPTPEHTGDPTPTPTPAA